MIVKVHSNDAREIDRLAIRKVLRGATAVSARVVEHAGAGAYGFRRSATIEIAWDNRITTRHEDRWCGKPQSTEGECYRPYVVAVGVRAMTSDGWDAGEDAACRLWAFGPREQARFAAAAALAEPEDTA